jgi:hypothetical protein
MTKKAKVMLGLCLMVMSFAVVQVSSMTYCSMSCAGSCGCEGIPFPGWNRCCFRCYYVPLEFDIYCCEPSWPGADDGCMPPQI